jgi:hypothetical protein
LDRRNPKLAPVQMEAPVAVRAKAVSSTLGSPPLDQQDCQG